jgi:hypothetical protein
MSKTATYAKIATTTLGSSTSSYTFSSIPSTYTDLVLISSDTNAGSDYAFVRFNSDSGANYSGTQLDGSGSAASSGRLTRSSGSPFSNGIYIGQAVNAQNTRIINIMDYANTTTLKTVLIRPSLTTYVSAYVGLWNSTAAINSITLTANSTTFTAGSTFTLYGIQAVN